MKVVLTATILFLSVHVYAQQTSKLFSDSIVLDKSIDKPTLFYTFVNWCGGNHDDFISIKDSIIKHRSKFYLVLLVDSITAKSNPTIEPMNPDKYIYLDETYPNRLKSKKEIRRFTSEINTAFKVNQRGLGPSAMFIRYKEEINFIPVERRSLILQSYLLP